MARRTTTWAWFGAAVAAGIAVEATIGQIGHRREAWDAPLYWSVGLPLMIAAALLFGFLARESPVIIGYAPFAGQLAAMIVKTGAGSMIVPGAILLAVLGAAGVVAAWIGVRVARRLG
jgi:hypothetical protein